MPLPSSEVLAIAAGVAIVTGIPAYALNSKTRHTFSYRFFSMPCIVITSLAVGMAFFDYYLHHGGSHRGHITAADDHTMLFMGVLLYLPVAFCNFWKTNLFVGASGTVAQISVIAAVIWIAGPYAVMILPLALMLVFMTRPLRPGEVAYYYEE